MKWYTQQRLFAYAYSNLSFTDGNAFAQTCARQYHLLRDYAMDHAEVGAILGATD